MKITDLIPETEFKNGAPRCNHNFDNCTSSYKQVTRNTLLFILPGVKFDTYGLAKEFIKSNPSAIIAENKDKFPKTKIPIFEVKNARRAFAFAMSSISDINYDELRFIGITGTNGKTSVATMLKAIIERSGEQVGFIGTGKIEACGKNLSDRYYSMTSPDPDVLYPAIKQLQNIGCTTIVMEVSSHALTLEKVAPIKFDIGVFTGLSHEHLDFHENMENYYLAKEKLISEAKTGIINLDDKYGRIIYDKYSEKCIGVGVIWRGEIYAHDIERRGLMGTTFIISGTKFSTKITLKLPGDHNIYNALLAFSASYSFGISPKHSKQTLNAIECIDGRFECIFDEITVIIDYAHTPAALENLLKTVKKAKNTRQNITLVFGCGGDRDRSKRALMANVAEELADKIIVTSDNARGESPEKIVYDIIAGFHDKNYGVILDRKSAIIHTIIHASQSDIVVIAGKGHEKYTIEKDGYHDFDEKEIIAEALRARRRRTEYENRNKNSDRS